MKPEVFDALPDNVQSDVLEYVGENVRYGDDFFDEWLAKATPRDVMGAYLQWNGIIGFTEDILFTAEELLRDEIIRIHEEE